MAAYFNPKGRVTRVNWESCLQGFQFEWFVNGGVCVGGGNTRAITTFQIDGSNIKVKDRSKDIGSVITNTSKNANWYGQIDGKWKTLSWDGFTNRYFRTSTTSFIFGSTYITYCGLEYIRRSGAMHAGIHGAAIRKHADGTLWVYATSQKSDSDDNMTIAIEVWKHPLSKDITGADWIKVGSTVNLESGLGKNITEETCNLPFTTSRESNATPAFWNGSGTEFTFVVWPSWSPDGGACDPWENYVVRGTVTGEGDDFSLGIADTANGRTTTTSSFWHKSCSSTEITCTENTHTGNDYTRASTHDQKDSGKAYYASDFRGDTLVTAYSLYTGAGIECAQNDDEEDSGCSTVCCYIHVGYLGFVEVCKEFVTTTTISASSSNSWDQSHVLVTPDVTIPLLTSSGSGGSNESYVVSYDWDPSFPCNSDPLTKSSIGPGTIIDTCNASAAGNMNTTVTTGVLISMDLREQGLVLWEEIIRTLSGSWSRTGGGECGPDNYSNSGVKEWNVRARWIVGGNTSSSPLYQTFYQEYDDSDPPTYLGHGCIAHPLVPCPNPANSGTHNSGGTSTNINEPYPYNTDVSDVVESATFIDYKQDYFYEIKDIRSWDKHTSEGFYDADTPTILSLSGLLTSRTELWNEITSAGWYPPTSTYPTPADWFCEADSITDPEDDLELVVRLA